MKIVSGGQTGADQVALEVAYYLGLETGGIAPKGYLTEKGSNLELKTKYKLVENHTKDYQVRTKQNVENSDGTIGKL